MSEDQDLVYRLRKRAEIRRQISTRKSVQEGKPDRIAALLDEAADEIMRLIRFIEDQGVRYGASTERLKTWTEVNALNPEGKIDSEALSGLRRCHTCKTTFPDEYAGHNVSREIWYCSRKCFPGVWPEWIPATEGKINE